MEKIAPLAAGEITGDVSTAAPLGDAAAHYKNIKRDVIVPWGQGPALLALQEGERIGSL